MVLRGNQIQRCGPARCALLTRRAFSRNSYPWAHSAASSRCRPDTVLPGLYPYVPRVNLQMGDDLVCVTIHHPNCTGHRARPLLHAPWSIWKGGSHVLPFQ